MDTTNYRGYIIEKDIYNRNEYTVQYEGDDYWFDSISEAKAFIDDMLLENSDIPEEFARWLDSSIQTRPFEASTYSIFEKLSLRELQKYLKPESESGYSYNDDDFVPEDNWWYIWYKDGSGISLEPGDSLKGIKRNNIRLAVNENANTTMIYGRSSDIRLYQDEQDAFDDIWRWQEEIL